MSKPKILIAEDDPDMLSLLGTLLELEGYQVLYYSETTPILTTVRNEAPLALLMDIHLSNENGLEVSRAIHRHRRHRMGIGLGTRLLGGRQ